MMMKQGRQQYLEDPSQPSHEEQGFCCSDRRGMGLIECLMSQQSNEIQYLNSEIRLLRSRNEYLKNDNELLHHQVAFLSEQNRLIKERVIEEVVDQVWGGFKKVMEGFQREIRARISQIESKEHELSKVIGKFTTKTKKTKTLHHLTQQKFDQIFKKQITNQRLSVRVKQLEQKLEELNIKYTQSFQWRPYFLPDFHINQSPNLCSVHKKKELRLDLQSTSHITRQQQLEVMSCRN